MIVPVPFSGLFIIWLFSAFILTLGIYILGKIMGWRKEAGFWAPFPAALLVTAILTLADWGLGFIPIIFLSGIFKIVIWLIVIMKVFELEAIEAIILAIVIFFIKLVFVAFVLSSIFASITP